jgi:hypothetical protein
MRGTVASETGLVGFEPIVVRGYGIVVGLRDTGSRQMPSDVRAFLTQELSKRGFGSGAPGAPKMSPQQLLNSSDTAVVIVEGVIPPGAPKGSKFDVRVTVAPGTSTVSLEGGRLLIADQKMDVDVSVTFDHDAGHRAVENRSDSEVIAPAGKPLFARLAWVVPAQVFVPRLALKWLAPLHPSRKCRGEYQQGVRRELQRKLVNQPVGLGRCPLIQRRLIGQGPHDARR